MLKATAAIGFLILFLATSASGPTTGRLPNRPDDPVIIAGKMLPGLAGVPANRLAAFRYDGQFIAIPFQVDEKNKSGHYAWAKGSVTGRDETAGLDANDELVFMAFDAGGQAPGGSSPAGAGAGAEVEITDPVSGDRAFAYIFRFAANPPRSSADYVSYSYSAGKGMRAQGQTYICQHPPESIYYTFQSLRQTDGTWSPDLADRLKIRGDLSAFMGTLQTAYSFDDLVKSRITGWIDGPVRVIRRGEGYLAIGEINIKGDGDSIAFYYPSWYIYPMMIDFPVNLRTYLTDITIHGAHDFTRAAYGAHYYDEQNPYNENIVLDGKMSAEEKKMKVDFDHGWLALTGPKWSHINRLFFPKEWSFIRKRVYYMDDTNRKDPPEDDPGEFCIGYDFSNFIGVSKGAITYYMHFYFPAQFKVGDEKRILDIVDRPVKVRVAAVAAK